MAHRLHRENYSVPGSVWHVSMPTIDRRSLLVSAATNRMIIDALAFQTRKSNAQLLLYCLMPDHLHAVISIGESDLVSFMRDFKSWTTRQWQRQSGESRLWQTSFHDHGVRRTEKIVELIAYVTENPQKAGLVDEWWTYPWLGGILIEEDPAG